MGWICSLNGGGNKETIRMLRWAAHVARMGDNKHILTASTT